VAEFQPRNGLFHPDLQWLAQMDEPAYRDVFRGSPIKRAKFAGLKRNLAIAMGNSGDQQFVPALEKMAADPDPVVAEHAQWALKKLGCAPASFPSLDRSSGNSGNT
jgi:epoxyqueuosine reductase